jgi:CspA family cold shock protein
VVLCFRFFPGRRCASLEVIFAAQVSIFVEAAMPEGKIKKVLSEKGFGFIEGEREDLFFHHSEVQGTSIEQLSEGQIVEYQVGQGKKGPCAVSVRLAEQTV